MPDLPRSSAPRRLDDVIDELGCGMAQVVLVLCGGSMYMLAGSLTMLFSLVNEAIAIDLGAGASGRGALVSSLFGGMLVGNLMSGVLSDRVGRRPPFLFAIVGVTLTTVCSATARSLLSLLAWRAMIGISFGFSVPPWNAIAGEMTPSHTRMEVAATSMALFCIGAVYTVWALTLLGLQPEDLAWRELTVGFGSQGVLLLGVAYAGVPESLRYLDYKGLRGEAVATLRRMRDLNGRPGVDIERWQSSEPEADLGIAPIFARALLPTTCTMCLLAFFLNFSYYGSMYALPSVLPGLTVGASMLASLLFATVVEIVGLGFAVSLCRRVTRKAALLTYLLGVAVTTAMLLGALLHGASSSGAMAVFVNVAVAAGRFFQSVGWAVAYVYLAEVYPTSCRAFGASVAIATGRVGGMVAPMAFEWLLSATGTSTSFFATCLGMAALNAALVHGLPVETKDRQLGDIGREAESLSAAAQLVKATSP